jgi:hypothetical protein
MDTPEMAATEPDVPGTDPLPRAPDPVGDAATVVEVEVEFVAVEVPPPHAAKARTSVTARAAINTD